MKFSKSLTAEFKKELFNAIRLSVFLTALVLGFLVFQNRTSTPEEIAASNSPRVIEGEVVTPKCFVNKQGNRVPASEANETDTAVECD